MTIEQKLNQARAEYRLKLVDRLGALGEHIARLRDARPGAGTEQLTAAQQLAHRICGSAGTFGFRDSGEAVRLIDQALLSLLETPEAATHALWDRLEQTLREALAACEQP